MQKICLDLANWESRVLRGLGLKRNKYGELMEAKQER